MSTNIFKAIATDKYNKEYDCNKSLAGSRESHEPRQLGEILQEFVNMSDSPLAKGYRAYLATKENAKDGGKEDE